MRQGRPSATFAMSRSMTSTSISSEAKSANVTMAPRVVLPDELTGATISPICVGMAERALELSVAHAKERKQFGEPIANFQMIQSRLADMHVCIETMRAYNYHCLSSLNDLAEDEGGRGWAHKLSATSVLYAADALNKVLDNAVQIHGGNGYIWETEINRLYRAIKLLEIGAGTTEVRKLIIAKELLAQA